MDLYLYELSNDILVFKFNHFIVILCYHKVWKISTKPWGKTWFDIMMKIVVHLFKIKVYILTVIWYKYDRFLVKNYDFKYSVCAMDYASAGRVTSPMSKLSLYHLFFLIWLNNIKKINPPFVIYYIPNYLLTYQFMKPPGWL